MNSLYLLLIFANTIIQARWIIPDYYDDYYYETERNLVGPNPIEFDINTLQEDHDIYPVYTERNLVDPSPLEFDTNTPQEDLDIPIYTNTVLNLNDTEFDSNTQIDEENYEREYEVDWDSKKVDLYNISFSGYITLNQVL